uniref:Myosin motor domain-containing protein n=1 Tax=Panagrellus redivivus TaxID=6233 RepID=A0A7E4VMD7_PANRE
MVEFQEYKDLEDLADLKNGNAILDVVAARCNNQQIYTLNGGTLLALNPNKNLEIYDVPTIEQYYKNGPFSDKAHIFSTANEALKNVQNGSTNENIVFGGTSGSGKTTNAFHVMRFLTTVARNKQITCQHINALQTIFESLGVAKTIKNDKATRFGYAVQFLYKKGELSGLNVTGVLPLEVGKLTSHRAGESSFPILYQLCHGLNAEKKDKLGLKDASKYFYLNQVENRKPAVSYAEDHVRFEAALKTIGFSENQSDIIYRLLAVVLHVGNIYFKSKTIAGGKQTIEIANESELKWIAHLLEIDWLELKTVFLSSPVKSDNDLDDAPPQPAVVTSIDKVLDIRDSFAKTIYNELFNWVLKRISTFFECADNDAKISVYDWFGFERYTNNSFEEFCINSVNEKLENLYINKIFKNFQTDYEDEGVTSDYKMPKGLDNERTIKMLFGRPCGLIPLLIDESRFPKGSDEAYLQRGNLNHLDKSIYAKPRSKDRYEFGVRHFAGLAYYYVSGFLQKNRWTELSAIRKLLATSDDPSLALLFPFSAEKGNRIVYTADEYAKSVYELVKKLESENCHFVRCVRVNSDRTSTKFDAEVVGRQMKSLSVQETYRMNSLGYPQKYCFEKFINLYRCLLPIEVVNHDEPQQIVLDILNGQGSKFISDFAVGSHSVFMKDRLIRQLNNAKEALQENSALIIQRNYRKHVARNNFLNQKAAAIRIQSAARGWSTRKRYGALKQESLRKVEETVLKSVASPTFAEVNQKDKKDNQVSSQAVAHLYELPEDLNTILNTNAPAIHKVRTQTTYLPFDVSIDRPSVDQLSIEEFAELNLKHHVLQARREPIFTPFLPKNTEEDFELSLKIFKLVLRYMNDNTITAAQRCILAKYIIQQGIQNLDQRDEIYMQLCNQTYNNKNPENAKGAWNLLLMAVNSFPPGYLVFPMLKDYFEQQNEPLATMLLEGLFRLLRHTKSPDHMNRNRVFAPTVLEQQSYLRRQPLVVTIGLPDGDGIDVETDSWTTIDEVVGRVLRLRGIAETEGWSLQIEDDKANSTAHGPSFLFDALSPFEVPQIPEEHNPFVSFETFPSVKPAGEQARNQSVSDNRAIPEISDPRTVHSAMDSSTLKRGNGILKSQSQTRLTPEEYAKMSVASRIRNMRIPANNGDVNRFLDEVFDQALPPNEDPTRDTIAASIKGGAPHDPYYGYPTRNGYSASPYYASPRFNEDRQTPASINLSMDDGRSSSHTMPRADDIPLRNRDFRSPSSPPMNGRVSRTYMNEGERPSRNYYESDYDVRPPITMQIRQNERTMTPNGGSETPRVGQITPTSQRARYLGANCGVPNGRPGPLNNRRRFESPAVERRGRNLSSRSKSTPRGFAHNESFTPAAIPPPDYDQDDESIYSRQPSRTLLRRQPRSTSSTPRTQRAFRYPERNDLVPRGSPSMQRIYNRNMELPSPAMTETPIYAPNGEYTLSRPASRQYLGDVRRSRSNTAMGDALNGGYPSPSLKRRTHDVPWTNDTPYNGQYINDGFNNNNGFISPNGYEHDYEDETVVSPSRFGDSESQYGIAKAPLAIKVKSMATNGARPATAYLQEPWKLTIRREVFFPGEQLDDADAIDLVFAQIIGDCRKNNPYRIRQFERERINFILNKHRVPVELLDNPVEVSQPVKIEIINEARKWPLYFSRMYPVVEEWSDSHIPMILGVSETGIRVMTRSPDDLSDPLQAKAHFDYHDITDVILENSSIIKIATKQNIVSRFRCNQAKQAIDFIHRFLDSSPKQKSFVTAISNYQIKDANLLSFRRGDIVQIVKPDVQNQAPSAGNWLYGKIGNRFGWFPAEYVQPASTTATNTESEYGSEIYAPPSAVHATYAAPSHYRTNNAIIYGSLPKGPDNFDLWIVKAASPTGPAMDPYRRSRSQSRFPPIDEHPGGYPTNQPLDRSHRSKSLDNRRDFVAEEEYDANPYPSIERNSTLHASMPRRQPRDGGPPPRDEFFNETVNVPVIHTSSGADGGYRGGKTSSRQVENQHFEDGDDNDFTKYDRQVRYTTERSGYPPVGTLRRGPPPGAYYDEYSYRAPIAPQGISPRSAASRYPESEFYARTQRREQHRPLDYSRSIEAQGGFQRDNFDRGVDYRYEEEAAAQRAAAAALEANRAPPPPSVAIAAGAGGAGGGGAGHRSYQYHHESHGGTGGGFGTVARQGAGGYSWREKRAGGFIEPGRRKEQVYHRIHCCCFTFKWPPWSYEECEPPRPIYIKPPKNTTDTLPYGPAHPPPPPQQQY